MFLFPPRTFIVVNNQFLLGLQSVDLGIARLTMEAVGMMPGMDMHFLLVWLVTVIFLNPKNFHFNEVLLAYKFHVRN